MEPIIIDGELPVQIGLVFAVVMVFDPVVIGGETVIVVAALVSPQVLATTLLK